MFLITDYVTNIRMLLHDFLLHSHHSNTLILDPLHRLLLNLLLKHPKHLRHLPFECLQTSLHLFLPPVVIPHQYVCNQLINLLSLNLKSRLLLTTALVVDTLHDLIKLKSQ